MNIFKKIKVGYFWTQALKYASEGEYFYSLEEILRIEKVLDIKGEFKLFKGFLCYELCDNNEAFKLLSQSCLDIYSSAYYADEEKKYLICYAHFFMNKCSNGGGRMLKYFNVDYSSISLNKVQVALKRNFPLREHPKWVEV